ncbi:MAG: hypothetical protein WHS87_11430 [Anaerolineales bacterium]
MTANSNLPNLDALAARTAQNIVQQVTDAKNLDILATKTLGVLQENGPYAMTLFLASRSRDIEKKIAQVIEKELFDQALLTVLFGSDISFPDGKEARLKFLAEQIAPDLDRLLLLKQVWEQTLIYVRYGAKARG